MDEEYESIMKNVVRDVVPRPNIMTSKFLFKIKHGVDEGFEKYKVIFVAI